MKRDVHVYDRAVPVGKCMRRLYMVSWDRPTRQQRSFAAAARAAGRTRRPNLRDQQLLDSRPDSKYGNMAWYWQINNTSRHDATQLATNTIVATCLQKRNICSEERERATGLQAGWRDGPTTEQNEKTEREDEDTSEPGLCGRRKNEPRDGRKRRNQQVHCCTCRKSSNGANGMITLDN